MNGRPFLVLGAGLLLAGTAEARMQPPASRSFERAIALEDSGATSAGVSIGDLNRDGHLDLVLVRGRHWPLHNLVFLGNGKGSFHPAVALALLQELKHLVL